MIHENVRVFVDLKKFSSILGEELEIAYEGLVQDTFLLVMWLAMMYYTNEGLIARNPLVV